MPAMLNGNQLVLTGAVGDDIGWGWGDCFTSSDVIMALAQVGDRNDIVIRLNSGGGIATEGSAIHSAIARHKGKKTVIVEGIAASAASVIAMAGDEVVMSLGAMLMIHDPSGFTVGTIVEHEAQIACLTALGDSMASIYAAKSGNAAADCRTDMKAEVWLTADQAVAKGYADRVEGAPASATDEEPAPFNYRMYAHTPERILALADARHWNKPRMKAPAAARQGTEKHMPNISDDDLKAQLQAAKAEGRAEGKTEAEAAAQQTDATMKMRLQSSEIAKLCIDNGVPAMTAALLAEGVTPDQAKARVGQAGEIKSMVALARSKNPSIPEGMADEMLASGKTLDQARAALFDHLVAKDESAPLQSSHRAGAGGFEQPGGESAAAARDKMKANMKAQIARDGGHGKAKEA